MVSTGPHVDRLGALGHIDEQKVAAAARLVRHGIVVPLNLPLTVHRPTRPGPVHHMLEHHTMRTIDGDRTVVVNDDRVELSMQGSSHWDSFAHFGLIAGGSDDVYYGGRSIEETSTPGPVPTLGIDAFHRGIVSRGVLLDLVRSLEPDGPGWLPDGLRVGIDGVRRAMDHAGVDLGRGDIAVIYTGFENRQDAEGRWTDHGAGIDASTVPLWLEREVAAVVADNVGVEALPPDYSIHIQLLRDAGVPLGELWSLRELAERAAELETYEFLLVSVPLNYPGALGSPANAVAIF